MKRTLLYICLFILILSICMPGAYAFGAGNIPSFAYLEGKAFRHGDIEDTLAEIAKKGGGGFALGSLLGKSKFGGLDIKRVYFGNWLRDYSQAVDIASLKKLQVQTIINLCMVMGFLAHGYATNEFEVTPERLGVYLPTEHIDNPKGYGDGEDARKYDPRLRGPVDPRELEVDHRTGMKNYIANEGGNWDTSKALVRRTLERCIHLGRQHRANGQKADLYESYRLLGQALHTLEDFPAHSNFTELALLSQGHSHVFSHVGDHCHVRTPQGKNVPPLVTGTFGSSDFIHSLLGEATDHLSEASVSDLNKEFSSARSKDINSPASSTLRELFFSLPGGSGGEMSREMEGVERIRAGPAAGGKRPEDISPQELHAVLWQVLSFRDSVVKKIEKTIEKIPGLGPLIEKLMDSISVFIFTTLEPYVKPLLKAASGGLSSASAEVIDNHDQYEVFNDPQASDPTHSFLSKDHFNLILNEPAGNLAKIIVTHVVMNVTRAWDDSSINVHTLIEESLECLFHPDFHNQGSKIQREMLQYMRSWVQSLGHKQHDILSRLSKDAVRNHRNVRGAGEGGVPAAEGTAAHGYGVQAQHRIDGYIHQIPGVQQAQSVYNQFSNYGAGGRREMPGPGREGSGYMPPPGPPPGAPPVTSGEAAEYFNSGPQQSQSTPGPKLGPQSDGPRFPSDSRSDDGPRFPSDGQSDGLRFPGEGYAPPAPYFSPAPGGPSGPGYGGGPPGYGGGFGPGYGGGGYMSPPPQFPTTGMGPGSPYAPPPGQPPSFPGQGPYSSPPPFPPGPPPPNQGGGYYPQY